MKKPDSPYGKFARDERGLEVVEYAILIGLIVFVAVGVIVAIGNWVSNMLGSLPTQ